MLNVDTMSIASIVREMEARGYGEDATAWRADWEEDARWGEGEVTLEQARLELHDMRASDMQREAKEEGVHACSLPGWQSGYGCAACDASPHTTDTPCGESELEMLRRLPDTAPSGDAREWECSPATGWVYVERAAGTAPPLTREDARYAITTAGLAALVGYAR